MSRKIVNSVCGIKAVLVFQWDWHLGWWDYIYAQRGQEMNGITLPSSQEGGGGHFHIWEYWGSAAELPALALGVFFKLPELGQSPFLSFQLWAPA